MEGQITFDAEGADYMTAVVPFRQQRTPYFSRILHRPGDISSGVTLGRGYDMGNRSTGEVFATLRGAGLEEYKASLCARAAGLKGKRAGEFVKVYRCLPGDWILQVFWGHHSFCKKLTQHDCWVFAFQCPQGHRCLLIFASH